MKKWKKILFMGCFSISFVGTLSANASMDLETESSVAGISVALNNFYANSVNPERELADSLADHTGLLETIDRSAVNDVPQVTSGRSIYEKVAISKVSNYVNVREEANTTSPVVGKIYNNCAATILSSIDGEEGEWYQIQSGNVKGYIKAQYFITGSDAEAVAKQIGKVYAIISNTSSLRLRESPDLNSKTLTLLSQGARYVVLEETDEFVKLAIDSDLEGYVSKDYIKTDVEFDTAISLEEEKEKEKEAAKIKKEAEDAINKLEAIKKEEAKKQAEKPKETTVANVEATKPPALETSVPKTEGTTIAAKPDSTTAAPASAPAKEQTTKAPTQAPGPSSPAGPGAESGSGNTSSSALTSATREAMVAYAKQFLGNPYVYGGTSLTNGADCSGFTQAIYSHFGISIGRSSRDQAVNGREIATNAAQPGDLLFYASGNYINHVAMYIGGGQVIHASSSTTGIILSPANYRTPCKAVTFLD